LGRPKKKSDFGSQLIRELNLRMTVNENGKRTALTKFELALKQLANKAISGNLPAMRLVVSLYQRAIERAQEERQSALDKANRSASELSDDELAALIYESGEQTGSAIRDRKSESDY
jgi:hypothetical protein